MVKLLRAVAPLNSSSLPALPDLLTPQRQLDAAAKDDENYIRPASKDVPPETGDPLACADLFSSTVWGASWGGSESKPEVLQKAQVALISQREQLLVSVGGATGMMKRARVRARRAHRRLLALVRESLRWRKALYVLPYLVCGGFAAICCWFIIAFGVEFENLVSGLWLQSNIISFILDGFLLSPVIGFLFVLLGVTVCGSRPRKDAVRNDLFLFISIPLFLCFIFV